jgi:hypothetical protein
MVPGNSAGRQRPTGRARVPLSARPYRRSMKSPYLAFMVIFFMIMATTLISVGQGRFSWLWIFPFMATAASFYSYRRERAAKNMAQGSLWSLAQSACALGAFALIALPANY